MLKRTLGEDGFNALAFGYLQVYPSRSYTLNELGRHFPGYLEKTKPCADTVQETARSPVTEATDALSHPDWAEFLIDLARLEWGIYEVFDGVGVEGTALLMADQVLAIPAERWPDARLNTVPCLQLLATGFPVNDYYTALRRHAVEEPIPIPGRAPTYVALTRRNFVVRRYNVSQAEFELLQALKSGASISQALESMLSRAEIDHGDLPEKLKLWFRNWTAEGFFESIS
jgi:Putative DNA-binding domain